MRSEYSKTKNNLALFDPEFVLCEILVTGGFLIPLLHDDF